MAKIYFCVYRDGYGELFRIFYPVNILPDLANQLAQWFTAVLARDLPQGDTVCWNYVNGKD